MNEASDTYPKVINIEHFPLLRENSRSGNIDGNNRQRRDGHQEIKSEKSEIVWNCICKINMTANSRCLNCELRTSGCERTKVQTFMDARRPDTNYRILPSYQKGCVAGELHCQRVKSISCKERDNSLSGRRNYDKKLQSDRVKEVIISADHTRGSSIITYLSLLLMALSFTSAAVQDFHHFDISLVIDNMDYTTAMEKNISSEFRDITDTLCLELSSLLKETSEEKPFGCKLERLRKTTTAKVEVRLNVDQLPIEVVKSKDGILTRIIQKSKHLTKEGTDYVEWKNYLIPISSIHVSQENETGPQTSNPLLDSDRPRRGVSPSPLPLVSEGSSLIVTTPKPRTTTVEIVWATNWWDVFLSRYKWGEDGDLFGAETGSTLSRVPEVDNCLQDGTCKNGGTCVSDEMSFSCLCRAGWTGVYCEKDHNECLKNPCNGRPCTNTVGSYSCGCLDGYTGKDCSIDIDECKTNPCLNNGVCTNTKGSYTCTCQAGWTSNNCLEDVNECDDNPCRGGSVCVNVEGSYACECENGWTGKNCTDDVDECSSSPCGSGGICENTVGSFLCSCVEGWSGRTCEDDVDECLASPCHNNGVCVNNKGSYSCLCQNGWTGRDCNEDIDECQLNNPCANDGVCTNTEGTFNCLCTEGWTGRNCTEDVDECLFSPCGDKVPCINELGSYSCQCFSGWTGKNCTEDIDECAGPQTCANGGLCKNIEGSFECSCAAGWTGSNCTEDVDECLDSPCGAGVPCFNVEGSYTCRCLSGWTGKNCTEDINECSVEHGLCNNGGSCVNTEGSYECQCLIGWAGESCEQDLDECLNNPCPDGSTCMNLNGSFTCDCTEGWTGQYCEIDIDECLTLQCGYGGTCNNLNGSFVCECPSGYFGSPCEDVDECKENPCLNGGICENNVGGFACTCDSGWEGDNCSNDVDECLLNPCSNGGVCQNIEGSYECECPMSWVGKNCTARMVLMGAEGQYGSTVTISCGVQGLRDWQTMAIRHDNKTLYQLNPSGVFTDFTNNRITINSSVVPSGAELSVAFDNLHCQDDGQYQCIVDGNSKNTMNVVVRKPATGGATRIIKSENIVDSRRRVSVRCLGHPSYPDGNLKFQVKMKDELAFQDFAFPLKIKNELSDDCSRTQTMDIDYDFDTFWDQAAIRCLEEDSGNLDDTVLDIIPDNYCLRSPSGTLTYLEHPNNPRKFVQCSDQIPTTVQECEEGSCFNENEQKCGSCIKECSENPCNNGASCWIRNGILNCDCAPGWDGSLCDIDEDECILSPCFHGGLCVNLPGSYKCNCTAGWQGPLCDSDLDECLANPCANGGECINSIASFTCKCPPGWTGPLCDIDINECMNSPCQNGGICQNVPGSYVCNCTSGWTGAFCEEDVDECLLNPCTNNGKCNNLIGSFTCDCPEPWFGKVCESGLFVDGKRGAINSENVVAVSCTIYKYQEWKQLDIIRSDKSVKPVVRVFPDGNINTVFNKRNIQVIYTPDEENKRAHIQLQFTRLRCRDEGVYKCLLNNGQNQDAKIIATNPSRGTPVISKIEELYGEANIPFNCTGYPGYPDGDLEFQVKLQNETDFHDFTFYSATRQNSDLGCIRKQTVNATYFMNMEWNQAKIRCKAKGSNKFDETNVYLLSPEICASVPINSGIRHPYNPRKYITCTRESPKVRNCPGTTCFNDSSQQCLFSCDNDD
ncbi:uncharacterized protein LOC111134788 [Crassostrea virginica]